MGRIYFDEVSEWTRKDWKKMERMFKFRWWSPVFLWRYFVNKNTSRQLRRQWAVFHTTPPNPRKDVE